jgi:hypothetical protein
MTRRREFTPKTKAAVRKRSGGICEADGCDRPAAEIDHKVECWEGGDNSLENAKDLCVECHLEKTNHSKSLKAWGNHFKVVKGRPKSGKIKSRGFQRGKSKIPSRPFEQKKQSFPKKLGR